MVQAGQPILRLSSPAVDEEAQRLLVERERFDRESHKGRDVSNALLAYQAERRGLSARVGLRNAEARRDWLLIRSPIAGRVISHRPEDLTGRQVVAGKDLVEIGDCSKMAADVGVSERLLPYLRKGAPVRALVRTSPIGYRYGSVAALSTATEGMPATAAAGKDPAPPTEMPDRFTAVAIFDNSDGLLLPGGAARVKILADREAYALRAGRLFWRWLRTIVW